jgi:hypothetical protein
MVLDLDECGCSTVHSPEGWDDVPGLHDQHKWVKRTEGVVLGHHLDGCLPDFSVEKDHVNDGRYWKFETSMEFINRVCGSK